MPTTIPTTTPAPTSSVFANPVATQLASSLSTTLDAYMNILGTITKLEARREQVQEDFVNSLVPKAAASTDAVSDATLQQYNDWKKSDDDLDKQVKGLEDVSGRLWDLFMKNAAGLPETASFLVLQKIDLLQAQIDQQEASTDQVRRRQDELKDHLHTIETLYEISGATSVAKEMLSTSDGSASKKVKA